MRNATTEEIIVAYRETGSVWAAGKRLGMSGQSVSERLRAVEFPVFLRAWTEAEEAELARLMAEDVPFGEIARRLGRTFGAVATRASGLGLKRPRRDRKKSLPRGAGWDKETTRRRVRELQHFDGTINQYARSRSLNLDRLVKAIQRHYPEAWAEYTHTHAQLPEAVCPVCGDTYYPMTKKQTTCSRKCTTDKRVDEQYFGGQRKFTIGLDEGVCQLCNQHVTKGLSSHHLLGKENDPGNTALIALCQGCHKLVTMLGGRTFADDPTAWENLINIVLLRRHGARAVRGEFAAVRTEIEIEFLSDEDDADEKEWEAGEQGRLLENVEPLTEGALPDGY